MNVVARTPAGIRPASVLQVALLVSLVSNLGRIPVFSTGESMAPLLVNDLATALVLASAAAVMAQRQSLQLDSVALCALLFAGIGGMSAIAAVPRFGLTGFELAVSLAYLARWVFYLGVYVAVTNTVKRASVDGVWQALEAMLLIFAAFGIVQSIFLPGFAQIVYPNSRIRYDFDEQGHRLVSTVLDPNIAAMMILFGLLVYIGRLSTGARVPLWKPTLLFVAFVLTLSRSGLLGLVFGGLVILLSRGVSKRALRFGLGLAFLVVLSLPRLVPFLQDYNKLSFGGSAAGRLENLAQVLTAFIAAPWIGVGFNTFGFYMERHGGVDRLGLPFQSSDGGLLFAAAMTGVIGLAVFLWMLLLLFLRCRAVWRDLRATPNERGLSLGVGAGVVALCIHSVFVNSLFSTAVLLPLWVLAGLIFAIYSDIRSGSPAVTPATSGAVVLTSA